MQYIWTYARAAVLRNGYRTLGMLLGTLLAIGLLSAVLFYVDASSAHMTQAAIAGTPVDMQVILQPGASAGASLSSLQQQLSTQLGVKAAAPFSLAGFTSSRLTGGKRATATTPGALIAVEPSYFSTFAYPQIVQGRFDPGGVLISKDMATNLGAQPGDAILLTFPAPAPPFTTTVTGIADLSGADLLFAPTDPQHRGMAFNPPANVAILDLHTFNTQLRDALLAAPTQPFLQQATFGAAAAATANGNSGGAVVSVVDTNEPPVSEQLHVRINRGALAGDPVQAQQQTEQLRRQLERLAPGQVRILNNLDETIGKVKEDVLWAKILLIFLAGPGILLAAYLSRYATANLIAAQRRELALLRARGATPRQVVAIITAISGIVALIGIVLGILLGLATNMLATGQTVLAAGNALLLARSAGLALVAGIVFALVAMLLPTRALYLTGVQAGRSQIVLESERPLWQRFYLDVACLAAGLIVLYITQQNRFTPVVGGEGNATLSLSLFTFLAPALIWLGAALLLLRFSAGLFKTSGGWISRLLGGLFGPAGTFAAQGMARRYAPLQQIALILILTVAFGVSLSGFAATYRQQQRVDAELTLGADVRVTPDRSTPQTAAFASSLRNTPGVVAATPFDLNVAYVGSELQDIFGVNVFSLRQTATLADSFFVDESADSVLSRLAATADGIVVSEETAHDYSIAAGDHINIRLQQANNGQFVTVPFQVVGVAREFPTAPKDSFLVVNQDFLHQQIGSDSVATFLVRAAGDPAQLAATLTSSLAAQLPAAKLQVESIDDVTAQLTSTLTTVSLEGLTRIEWVYALLIAALALTIFLTGLLAERRTEYATLSALGATPIQVNIFILCEAAVAGVTGIIAGTVVGLALSQVLVTILTAIFDPPPSSMLVPFTSIGLLLALVSVGLIVSALGIVFLLGRLRPAQVLHTA